MEDLEAAVKAKDLSKHRLEADTSFLAALSGFELWAVLLENQRRQRGMLYAVSERVFTEYNLLHYGSELDWDNVPKAQMPWSVLVKEVEQGLTEPRAIEFKERKELGLTDSLVIARAEQRAEELGKKVYLLTSDSGIFRQGRTISRDVLFIGPRRVENNLSYLVPKLELLVDASVLAGLWKLWGAKKSEGYYAISVKRKQPFAYGGNNFNVDTASDIRLKKGKARSDERHYEVPVVFVNKMEQGEFIKALTKVVEQWRALPEMIAVSVKEYKGLPYLLKRDFDARERKDLTRMLKSGDPGIPAPEGRIIMNVAAYIAELASIGYYTVPWARLPSARLNGNSHNGEGKN